MKLIIEIEVKNGRKPGCLVLTPRFYSNMRIDHNVSDLTPFMLDLSRNDFNILFDVAYTMEKAIRNFDLSKYPLITIPKEVQERE